MRSYEWLSASERETFKPYLEFDEFMAGVNDKDNEGFFDRNPNLDQAVWKLHLEADTYAREKRGQQMPPELQERIHSLTVQIRERFREQTGHTV